MENKETPKPKPPVSIKEKLDKLAKEEESKGKLPKSEPPKKPYERKPHLTHRPFRGNTELSELQRKLSKPKFKNR